MSADNLPTIAEAKSQAMALRERLGAASLSQSAALERVAHAHGYRDWNTFRASLAAETPWAISDRVRGRYLGHGFEGRIFDVTQTREGWFRLTLQLDEAVDVVASAHFSNFRKRVSATVGRAGTSREKTSDGAPQMVVARDSD